MPAECHRDECEAVVRIGNAGCKLRGFGNHMFRVPGSAKLQQYRGQETMRGKTDCGTGNGTLCKSQRLFEAAGLHQALGIIRRDRSGDVHALCCRVLESTCRLAGIRVNSRRCEPYAIGTGRSGKIQLGYRLGYLAC